jgi:hypothetical protein
MDSIIKVKKSELSNFLDRAKHLYHIRSENNTLVTYEPNEAQIILNNIKEEEFERSMSIDGVKKCKLILLKSRQIGGTTDTAVFNLDTMLNLDLAYGLVLAHDDKSTNIIYEKYKVAYNNIPDIIEIVDEDGNKIDKGVYYEVKPNTESYTGYKLQFSNKTKSRLLVRTAGAGDNVGRGDTLNFVHLSEGASYDHFDDVLTSINQSLPRTAFNYSIIESTANGISGKGEGFYNLWKKSVDEWEKFKSGRSTTFEGYRPVFISWYEMKKYRKDLVNGELIEVEDSVNFGSPENKKRFFDTEKFVIEEIFKDNREEGLRAVNWYRWCVKENCNYDYARARREYPTFPEDAFLSTDLCFFDTTRLFTVLNNYEKEEPEFERGFIDYDSYGELEFIEDPFGDLKIWEKPDPTYMNRYIVSLDPSYGMEEGDYSCMFVFDRLEQKFVAKWYGNMKEDLVADELLKIAYYYNEALVIPEMNLNTVMTLIKPDGLMPYSGEIYQRHIKSRNSDEYGFHTLGNTRKLLLDTYNAWLREDYYKIPDIESLKEHISFIKRKGQNGIPKYEAAEGKHDDQVIAMALCIIAHHWWEEEVWELDEDKQDVSKIFVVNPAFKRRDLRSSQLGHFKDKVKTSDKKTNFNKLGLR